MNTEHALQAAGELLAGWVIDSKTPEINRLDIRIEVGHLLEAVQAIDAAHWGYLAAITGLDPGAATGQLEVLYHFCAGAAVVTLRVPVPRDQAAVPSICDLLPAASFYERELREMLGVEVTDLSNIDHLFLPDDWPDGVYPLRKDAVLEESR